MVVPLKRSSRPRIQREISTTPAHNGTHIERPNPPTNRRHCHPATHPPVCPIAGDEGPPPRRTAVAISADYEFY